MSWSRFGSFGLLIASLLMLLAACSSPARPADSSGAAAQPLGLNAEYFSRPDFSGPSFRQLDGHVAFNWGKSRPSRGSRPGPFSARWSGFLAAPTSEAYTFYLSARGKAQLYLNNQLVASEDGRGGQVNLKAGQKIAVRVEFAAANINQEADLRLEWESPSQKRQVIPQGRFYPNAKAATAALATSRVGAQAVPGGVELLLNPDFEQGTAGWVELAGGTLTTTTPGRGGSGQAARTDYWTYAAQALPYDYVNAGPSYTLEGWGSSPNGVACIIGLRGGTASNITFDAKVEFRAGWEQKNTSLALPAGTVWAEAYIQAQAGTGQACQFDDLSLHVGTLAPLPSAPALTGNVLDNPGFEQDLTSWTPSMGTASTVTPGHSGKTLQFTDWSWFYQAINSDRYVAASAYVLKGWVRATTNQACTLGLQGGNGSSATFDQTFSYRTPTWQEIFVNVPVPQDTNWMAAYFYGSAGCQFDDLVLATPSGGAPAPVGLDKYWTAEDTRGTVSSNWLSDSTILAYVTKSGRLVDRFHTWDWPSRRDLGSVPNPFTEPVSGIGMGGGVSGLGSNNIPYLSPDRSRVALVGTNEVQVWTPAFDRRLLSLPYYQDGTRVFAWSPDSSRVLLSTGSYGSVEAAVYDARTGAKLVVLDQGQNGHLADSAWSPDGSRIYGGSGIWDAATGVRLMDAPGANLRWSPDGTRMAGFYTPYLGTPTLTIFDATSGTALLSLTTLAINTYSDFAVWSHDGTRLALTTAPVTTVLDSATGAVVGSVPISGIGSTSPDGSKIVMGASVYDSATFWNSGTLKLLGTLTGGGVMHSGNVYGAAFNPNGTALASAGRDHSLLLWRADIGRQTLVPALDSNLPQDQDGAYAVAWSPDGSKVASAGVRGAVDITDATTGATLNSLYGHTYPVRGVAWSPDGTKLASGSWDHRVKLWDAASGAELFNLEGHADYVNAVAFSPDGTKLASASSDRTLKVWKVSDGSLLQTLTGATDSILALAWSPDGSQLLSGGSDRSLRVWDASSGQLLQTFSGFSAAVRAVVWIGNRAVAGAGDEGKVLAWDSSSGQPLFNVAAHNAPIFALALTPDGKSLVTAASDQTLVRWTIRFR